MRILITGAGGFIGSHLSASFLRAGYEIIAVYRNTKPRILSPSSGLKAVQLDLSEGLQGVEAADVVIHTAAHTHLIPDSTAFDYIRSNVTGTLHLAAYAKAVRPKLFVYLSTISVYGEITVSELDEETPLNKPEMYGLTKYMGELILREYADHFPSVCIRLPGVVGVGYFTPWLGKMVRQASRHELIQIYNPDSLFNNVIDLTELQRFISWILTHRFTGFECVNLAAAEPMKIRAVIDLIVSLTGSQSQILEQETSKQSFSIKTEKIERIFGFEPATTQTIIHRYITENLPILNGREGKGIGDCSGGNHGR